MVSTLYLHFMMFLTVVDVQFDRFTKIKFWKFILPKMDSWSLGQKKLMSENAFFPNMPPKEDQKIFILYMEKETCFLINLYHVINEKNGIIQQPIKI